jgi:predicted negative regulator of RcsB-dependent stress response
MSEFRDDDEQLELVRNWWKENGSQLLWGLAIVAAAVAGYRAYTSHLESRSALASTRYDQFVEAFAQDTPGAAATRDFVLGQLKEEHADSGYTALAVFLDVQRLVASGDLEAAKSALEWVLASDVRGHLEHVALLRLARVQWALGDADGALQTLAKLPAEGFAPVSEELRGDILHARGDHAGAHAAYARAVEAAGDAVPNVLQIKLDDVAAVAASAGTAGGAAAAPPVGATVAAPTAAPAGLVVSPAGNAPDAAQAAAAEAVRAAIEAAAASPGASAAASAPASGTAPAGGAAADGVAAPDTAPAAAGADR